MKGKIVPWLWIAIVLILIIRTTATIYRLWKTGDQVGQAEKKLAELKGENEELTRQWHDVRTPEYMERQVREKLGYGKPGEVQLVMPSGQVESENPPAGRAGLKVENESIPNWQKWRKLYLGY